MYGVSISTCLCGELYAAGSLLFPVRVLGVLWRFARYSTESALLCTAVDIGLRICAARSWEYGTVRQQHCGCKRE
jgi:hypothetical protein